MLIPEGFCQVNLRFTGTAAPLGAEVTFGIDNTALDSPPALVANEVGDAWATAISPNQCNQIVLATVLCKNGPNESGPFSEQPIGEEGGSSTPGLAANTALLVTKETALGGRSGRGRMFVPGYPESVLNAAGTVDVSALPNYQIDFSALLAALATADYPMALLHADSSFLTPYEVTALTVQGTAATQRRRMRG